MTTQKRDLNQGKKKSATLEKRAAPMTFGAAAAMSAQQDVSAAHRTTDSYKHELRDSMRDMRADQAQEQVHVQANTAQLSQGAVATHATPEDGSAQSTQMTLSRKFK